MPLNHGMPDICAFLGWLGSCLTICLCQKGSSQPKWEMQAACVKEMSRSLWGEFPFYLLSIWGKLFNPIGEASRPLEAMLCNNHATIMLYACLRQCVMMWQRRKQGRHAGTFPAPCQIRTSPALASALPSSC